MTFYLTEVSYTILLWRELPGSNGTRWKKQTSLKQKVPGRSRKLVIPWARLPMGQGCVRLSSSPNTLETNLLLPPGGLLWLSLADGQAFH